MRSLKLRGVVVAVSGALFLGFGASAMADSTTDIVNALVSKGVLTEEEGALIAKGHDGEKQTAESKEKKNKSKIVLGDYIDSITPTGDIRVRYETREAKGQGSANPNAKDYLGRGRYAWHLGLKTTSDNDFFTEIRFASNSSSRSPNVDFAQSNSNDGTNGKFKGSAYVDRAYIGWNATDWMTLIAGRQENPLYTSSLVWDGDITPEGLTEKFKTKLGNNELFATLGQWYLKAKYETTTSASPTITYTKTTKIFPMQIGTHGQLNDNSSYKVAATYYLYAGDETTGGSALGKFNPGSATTSTAAVAYGAAGTQGVNNLQVLEIPAEYNWMMGNHGMKVFGTYTHNFDGDARALATGDATLAQYGGEDTAMMLGMQIGSAPDLKTWEKGMKGMKKHDWVVKAWYQRVEAFALDANLIDSDIMNAQVNLQGVAAAGHYMLSDNAFLSLIGAHATRINDNIGTGYSVDTSGINTKTYNMLQADVTWRF